MNCFLKAIVSGYNNNKRNFIADCDLLKANPKVVYLETDFRLTILNIIEVMSFRSINI